MLLEIIRESNSLFYKNLNFFPRSGLRSFTANKTNVENAVYDSEGFTVCYYAVKEYHIAADGTETLFQTRSYIKVK